MTNHTGWLNDALKKVDPYMDNPLVYDALWSIVGSIGVIFALIAIAYMCINCIQTTGRE